MSGDHNQYQKDNSYLDFECPRCGHCCQAKGKAMQLALDMLNEIADHVYCDQKLEGVISALSQALVDADDTSQERVDEIVKDEHDKQVTIAQAYERGWNAALAQQEPVAWRTFDGEGGYDYRSYEMNETYDKEWAERNPNHKGWVEPLYTAPPKREWVGLTALEIYECWKTGDVVDAVEAKLKEKNT